MIGDTATTSSRRAGDRARTPGTARTGAIDTSGFEGAMTTTSAAAMASRTPGAGRGVAGAGEAHPGDRDVVVALHEVLLEAHLALGVGVAHGDHRPQGVVGGREQAQTETPGGRDLVGDGRQGRAGRQPAGAVEVRSEVAIAELEPGVTSVATDGRHRLPRLVPQTPAGVGIDLPGEGVGDGVDVGADVQPVQRGVVADVDDRGDLGGRDHLHQAGEEPSRADATREDGDQRKPFSSPLRRAKSASTIMRTSSGKLTFGSQPSALRILVESPTSRSTSAGRKNRSSITTWSS